MRMEVFDSEIVAIGFVDIFTALRWTEKYDECGSFEMWCPATAENAETLKEDHILWLGDKSAGVIDVLQKELTQENTTEIHVKGRLIEGYLSYRTLWDTYTATNEAASNIMREIVNTNCISTSNTDRVLPRLKLKVDQEQMGSVISMQKTGSDVLSVLEELSASQGLGFDVSFYPKDKVLEFEVTQGTDRTGAQKENSPVVFSTDTEDILSSLYYHNKLELRTLALVAGAGEGSDRIRVSVGSGSGLNRREIFVDARDLQDTDNEGNNISTTVYEQMLVQRGETYLGEKKDIESFDAVIKTSGEQQYVYGVDYKKGDLVTVQDQVLGITVNARITEVERIYDQNGYTLNLMFGYSQPTLNEKLKFLGLEV